ncbi:MAG: ribosomal protein S18-alanine N-acetyltransferase [Lachnospiraceae bacterium]|nr:ribosomal protein S18-alanine N-acetyltransferase [Lachnospiraceae bacterium]
MFVISPMNDENVEGVAVLEKENFSDGWSLNSLKEELNNPNAVYFVMKDENSSEVVAAAGMIVSFDIADIMNVSVKKEYRRNALGSRLIERLLEDGRKIGVKEFVLEVRENNEAARKLYEKEGFVFEGIRPDFYSNPKENAALYRYK